MKILRIPAVLIVAAIIAAGCAQLGSRTAYKTLASLEMTTTAAVDGYYAATIKGIAPTNGIPQVSSAFNKFQKAFLVAVDVAQNNTNALAPDALVQESADVTALVGQFYNPSVQKITPTP